MRRFTGLGQPLPPAPARIPIRMVIRDPPRSFRLAVGEEHIHQAPSGRLGGDKERLEHLTHFTQLIMGLKAARVG
jgi:hypothetical protein